MIFVKKRGNKNTFSERYPYSKFRVKDRFYSGSIRAPLLAPSFFILRAHKKILCKPTLRAHPLQVRFPCTFIIFRPISFCPLILRICFPAYLLLTSPPL